MKVSYLLRFALFPALSVVVTAQTGDVVEDVSEIYEWDRVPIGGGGYQTGVVTHPDAPGLMYLKGDVMGLHRRKPDENRWVQTFFTFTPDDGYFGGTGGLDVHPEEPGTFYVFLGRDADSEAGIYKSTDYGGEFEQLLQVYERTNQGDERKWANNVAVDPNNGDVVYFGTRNDGLLRTTDGGETFDFQPHPDIPTDPDEVIKKGKKTISSGAVGTRNIVIDPSETVGNPTRSRVVYAAPYSKGLYRSVDGGERFTPVEGGPDNIRWMKLAPDGSLYLTARGGGGVWHYDGEWNRIREEGVNALAVDPHDPSGKTIFLGQAANPDILFRSQDGGKTWETLEMGSGYEAVYPENWEMRKVGQALSTLDFDRAVKGRLYLCDAFGAWVTDDPLATPIQWRPLHEGLEGTVSFTVSAPPATETNAPLYTGGSDANNYSHMNPAEDFPHKKLSPIRPPKEPRQWIAYCSDYEYCMADPNVMYRVVGAHNNRMYVSKTTNGGKNPGDWEVVASSYKHSPLPSPVSWNGRTRKLAVSGTDPDAVLMAGAGGYGNHYTLDGGETWTRMEGVLKGDDGFIDRTAYRMYGRDKPIAADRVNGDYFYGFKGKQFYVSDGKAANGTWRETFKFPDKRDPNRWHENALSVAAAPYEAGTVAINLGRTGLWLSRDFGETFEKIEVFADCRSVGWGAPAPGSENSTLYAFGKIGEQWGIYASVDFGESWFRMTPAGLGLSGLGNLTGDLNEFGTVYFSNSSMGVGYGRLRRNME